MLAKSLVIFISIGVISGLLFGVYLIDVKNTSQLIFVEGSSLSIVTEKIDFKKGESVSITIVNSGTVPLTFSDASYGLKITALDGMHIFSPISAQVISTLEPKDEITFVWEQIKNDGQSALEGVYKISSQGFDLQEKKIEKSITINILKWFYNITLYIIKLSPVTLSQDCAGVA